MSVVQYIKDTRAEMAHVAWPTRVQTVVFTILVILVSLLISLYLGFFDYVFTTSLARSIELLPQAAPSAIEINEIPVSTDVEIPASFDITDTSAEPEVQ